MHSYQDKKPYLIFSADDLDELEQKINEACYDGYILNGITKLPTNSLDDPAFAAVMQLNIDEGSLGHICNLNCLVEMQERYNSCQEQYEKTKETSKSLPDGVRQYNELNLAAMEKDLERQQKTMSELQKRLENASNENLNN